jgi:CRISPR-associated protein Csm4
MKIVYLTPRSSHRNTLRSDTLWGLICWGIRTVYSENSLVEFIDNYNNEKVVKISSAFPYIQGVNGKQHYFSKPILKPIDLNKLFDKYNFSTKEERTEQIKRIKKYKKVKFIEQSDFEKFLQGNLNEEEYFLKGSWMDGIRFWNQEEVLHNTINRLTNTTSSKSGQASLYTTLEYFPNNSGLFFLMDGDKGEVEKVEGALRFLSHIGFGGDSSIGKNSFRVTVQNFNIDITDDAEQFISLSLYMPTQEEATQFSQYPDKSWYDIETRKGKFGGHFIKQKRFWKDSVLMFKEGSVFPNLNKNHYGQNKVVLNSMESKHFDVYQYGFAFNLPIKTK